MNLAMTSKSDLKHMVVSDILKTFRIGSDIKVERHSTSGTPKQPLNSTLKCCRKRIENLISEKNINTDDTCFLSIENGIEEKEDESIVDVCYVVLKTPEKEYVHRSQEVVFDNDWFYQALKETPNDYEYRTLGLSVTIGEIVRKELGYDPKNWIGHVKKGFGRTVQIEEPLRKCFLEWQKDELEKAITFHKDFPKPGVVFQDVAYSE
jgi:hypothetical protein